MANRANLLKKVKVIIMTELNDWLLYLNNPITKFDSTIYIANSVDHKISSCHSTTLSFFHFISIEAKSINKRNVTRMPKVDVRTTIIKFKANEYNLLVEVTSDNSFLSLVRSYDSDRHSFTQIQSLYNTNQFGNKSRLLDVAITVQKIKL